MTSQSAKNNSNTKRPLFGIYVHWPFCESKCPYCDFNSHVREQIDHEAFLKSFIAELEHYAQRTKGRQVTSIFFGGGTPSLMEPGTVQAIIDKVQNSWHIANDCEITLEANPGSTEADKFADFAMAGVNRVSIGVQALNDDDLKFLGRKHDVKQARKAIEIARSQFERFSFDLIYARPEQTISSWTQELKDALSISAGHLSLYQLTIEKGTPFYVQHGRGDFSVPEDDTAANLYEITQELLEDANMPAYEVSNHAISGQESVHNMTYWQYDDYIGVGPGAHGRLNLDGQKFATRAHRAPEIWLDKVLSHGHGAHDFEEISSSQRFSEALMMGLRLADGISLDRLISEGGQEILFYLDDNKIKTLIAESILEPIEDKIILTPKGRLSLNGVLRYLLA